MPRHTLFGAYNYDPTIFDEFELPEALDKDVLIDLIIRECGELYTYHQHPAMLKRGINYFFKRRFTAYERIALAFSIEYNPLENYDRMEDTVETPDIRREKLGSDSAVQSGSSKTKSATNSRQESTSSNVPFNASSETERGKDVTSLTGDADSNYTEYKPELVNTTNYDSAEHETGTNTRTSRIHGNIGVTQYAQMAESEIEMRKFDLYKFIVSEFENEFLVRVY